MLNPDSGCSGPLEGCLSGLREIPSVWGAQLRPHEGPGHRGSAEIHLTVQGQFLNISSKQGKERMNMHFYRKC